MKIAIVGSSGYIAGFLIERWKRNKEIEHILRLDQSDEAEAYINLQRAEEFNYSVLEQIDFIIFTAAISGPDQCASDFDFCWKINVTGTSYFIRKAIEKNCRVVFFSSDAVFGDYPNKIFDEESKTDASTPYGKMKKAVEDEFAGEQNFKAIRLSYVSSAKDRFVSYCLNCIRNGETADVFHPFYRNAVSVHDVVQVVDYLINHWNTYTPQFLNVAGKELVSRVRIADEINRYSGNRLQYTVSMPGKAFFENRPQITHMKSLYGFRYGVLSDNTFTEKIVKELEEIKL